VHIPQATDKPGLRAASVVQEKSWIWHDLASMVWTSNLLYVIWESVVIPILIMIFESFNVSMTFLVLGLLNIGAFL
jgi:hypothetical protein